jgi:indole-3-glycerol phosphate synthase
MTNGEDFLVRMSEASEVRARRLIARAGGSDLRRQAMNMPAPPALRLSQEGFDIIAEIKLSSPSAGSLSRDTSDIERRAAAYAEAGACAVSVLTEPDRFGGSIDHLQRAARALESAGIPAMAKDFLVAPEQVWAARAAGAGGILLIIRMLDQTRLAALLDVALELEMFVLLEAFDRGDLDRAAALGSRGDDHAGPVLLGLNCRNLRTLQVDPGRFGELAECFPRPYPRVAESGIEGPEDVAAVASRGYSIALVGTALMRSRDPGNLVKRMIRAGRSAPRDS